MVKQFVSSVCMVCLLCAIHSHCAAHRGPAGADPATAAPHAVWLDANGGDALDPQPRPVPVHRLESVPSSLRGNAESQATESDVNPNEESPSERDDPRDVETNGSVEGGARTESDVAERLRLPRDLRPAADLDEQFFIRKVFEEFGDGKTISYEGFEQLLKTLMSDEGKDRRKKDGAATAEKMQNISRSQTQLNSSADNVTNGTVKPGRCLKPRDLFAAFSAPSNRSYDVSPSANRVARPSVPRLDEGGFYRACPSLVYAAAVAGAAHTADRGTEDEGWCVGAVEVEASQHRGEKMGAEENQGLVWLYSTLSVVLISLCGLAGVAVIPIMQHMFYQQLLQFFVALAIGTLCGDALLHLLPHAMSSHTHDLSHGHDADHQHDTGHDTASMWKGLVAALGIVFLTFAEKFLSLGSEWRSQRQRKKKQGPQRVRVMRDLDSLGSSTVGEKLCKHKYSSYPYCYDEITTEMTDDHHHKTAQYSNSKCGHEHNHNHAAPAVAAPTALGTVNESGDGHTVVGAAMDNGTGGGGVEANGKEAEAGAVVACLAKEDVDNGGDYTVYLREHENTHHGHSHTHGHVFSSHETMSSVAWMVVMGDGLHNFTDGMAIGAAFAANIAGGFSTAVAVFCHELPHELGDFAVLLKAGMSAKQAVFYNILSSVLCLAGMVLGVSLGNWDSATEWIFAGAAGTFLYIALVDMIPELTSSHSKDGRNWVQLSLQIVGMLCGLGIMFTIAIYEEDLKNLFTEREHLP